MAMTPSDDLSGEYSFPVTGPGQEPAEAGTGVVAVPWVVRDVVRDINRASGKRWQAIDPLLPQPRDLPAGCADPFQTTDAKSGRAAGFAVCRHQYYPADSLLQTWGAATQFVLTPRLRERDTCPGLDDLLAQWHDHLESIQEAHTDDTAALVTWPSRDVTGVKALLKHGLQPMTVLAVRVAGRSVTAAAKPDGSLTIRRATPRDEQAVAEMEMGVILFDEQFGGAVPRPATANLIRQSTQAALAKPCTWTWLAEKGGTPVGLLVVQPPADSTWVAAMTARTPAAYLATMFVKPAERGAGIATELVRKAHAELDEAGVAVTVLHHSQVNPVSGPFWNRMGYRPLWTSWETRPAAALRP
jgi:GNAT superfamily N-acetyltransferase